jgi:hypothetical protein
VRVGYGKIGRVLEVNPNKWGESGGDNEPAALLLTLAKRNPEVTWVCVGRNSGWEPPLPNIENPWQHWLKEVKFPKGKNPTVTDHIMRLDSVTMPTIAGLDGQVLWLGQHGTSNSPIPQVADRSVLTSPQISFVHYSSFILRGINAWRAQQPLDREEVWLLPDPRNYNKARDLKWPRRHPTLCQYTWSRQEWCERYGDPRTPQECGFDAEFIDGKWRAFDNYVGSGLELVGVPGVDVGSLLDFTERDHDFGILINENRNYGMRPELTRLHIMQHYVKPLHPSWVRGTWSKTSNDQLGLRITPLEYGQIFPMLQRTKATFTTPASGSQWATAKPWECFSAGVICFFHPMYDTQGHIIPRDRDSRDDELQHLAQWLRVKDPDDLAKKVKAVTSSRETYEWLATAQLRLLQKELTDQRCVTAIERRLGI